MFFFAAMAMINLGEGVGVSEGRGNLGEGVGRVWGVGGGNLGEGRAVEATSVRVER